MAKRATKKRAWAEEREILPAEVTSSRWKLLAQGLALVAAALCVYWPALSGDWLWDDDILVTGNSSLRSLDGLGQIWFSTPTSDYWPLSWTLLWVEWHLWGNETLGYHLCSVALHISSGFLIWRLLCRLGARWGWLGGLLFVIHPLAVESVAWIAEIKNTLSLPFFLLSCHAWLDAEEKKTSGYLRSILFYAAAMLAKTSTVMLPAVLLLYCWWKRGRVTRRELERMIPYAVIAVALGLVTVYFQNHGAYHNPVDPGGFFTRTIGAGTALFFYLGKFFLPVSLLPIYPRWTLAPPTLLQILTLPALAFLLFGLWMRRSSWGRHTLFGFGFFLLNLLPVLGWIKMRYMSVSWVADHLTYLPMIGLIGLVVAGLEQLKQRVPAAFYRYGAGVIAATVAWLVWESHGYAGLFVNQETLWTYTLLSNPHASVAHTNLGIALQEKGRIADAILHFDEALRIDPEYAEAHYNLGTALMKTGQTADAIDQYTQALRINPGYAKAHYNLGNALMKTGRADDAIEQYEQAVTLNPDYAGAYNNLGAALLQSGHVSEAVEQYERAVLIEPGLAEAHYNLGAALMQAGRASEAAEQFEEVLQIHPNDAEALNNLARAQALPQSSPAR